MNTTTHHMRLAERLGRWLGRGRRAYTRGEQRVTAWLVSHGVPAVGARIALWIIKLSVMAVLLYVAVWWVLPLALLSAIAAGAATAKLETPDSDDEPQAIGEIEWRAGPDGPGLYGGSDCTSYRID